MRIIVIVLVLVVGTVLGGCRCDPPSGRNTGAPASDGSAPGSGETASDGPDGAPGSAAGSTGAPGSGEALPQYRAPKGTNTRARYSRSYDELTDHYRRLIRRLVAAFRSAAVGAHSLGEFFEKSGPALERYDAARQNLRSDYSRVARSERNNLNRDLARARALDKKEKGMRNVRAFLEADERRERERAAQVRRLQQLLDEAAAAVGRTFRGSFHEKLEGEMAALRKQGSSPEETRQARERNVAAIEKGLPRASADARQRKRYAESWVAWFLRHKSEPPVAKKEALPDETEHIVLKPARPDPLPKEEPPAKKAEPPSKQDIDLACENNECNLEQYRRFLARLPRSCRGSPLPDVLIKHCFPDFVHLDLSSGRRREIMNFIWFSGDNFFDRMRGLAYFEDVCYRFRPALELGDQMIGPDNAFTTDQKIRIRQALDNIRRCR